MANTGGKDGTVGPIATTAGGSSVAVSYPMIPAPPEPPQAAHTDVYEDVTDPFLRRFENAKAGDDKVNVVVGAGGNPTAVTQQ